jgi:hypothetical protein
MLPIASTPFEEMPEETAAPRHLLSSIRKLNALYDELNQIIERARSTSPSPPR